MSKGSNEETVIAQGVRVEGDFVSAGDMYIEGEVKGNIKTEGDLRLGVNAKIEADIAAKNAVVSGEVHGNIVVSGKLELMDSASIIGDVICDVISVTSGAKMNGKLSMGGANIQHEEERDKDGDE